MRDCRGRKRKLKRISSSARGSNQNDPKQFTPLSLHPIRRKPLFTRHSLRAAG
ncbi:hypothetical protein CGRA01v4_12369 [Colletotrichum graminicola]|nr:hypothetical protein CGRA01v4_12369 [Colletotrichum graminicola]